MEDTFFYIVANLGMWGALAVAVYRGGAVGVKAGAWLVWVAAFVNLTGLVGVLFF